MASNGDSQRPAGLATTTRSMTFYSREVSSFLDDAQHAFAHLLLCLAPYIVVESSTMSLSLDFGPIHKASLTMVAEPINRPFAFEGHPSRERITMDYIQQQVAEMRAFIQSHFNTLVRGYGRAPSVMVIHLNLSDQVMHYTLKVNPYDKQTLPSVRVPPSDSSDSDSPPPPAASGEATIEAAAIDLELGLSEYMGSDGEGEDVSPTPKAILDVTMHLESPKDDQEETPDIMFYPIKPGCDFFAQFEGMNRPE